MDAIRNVLKILNNWIDAETMDALIFNFDDNVINQEVVNELFLRPDEVIKNQVELQKSLIEVGDQFEKRDRAIFVNKKNEYLLNTDCVKSVFVGETSIYLETEGKPEHQQIMFFDNSKAVISAIGSSILSITVLPGAEVWIDAEGYSKVFIHNLNGKFHYKKTDAADVVVFDIARTLQTKSPKQAKKTIDKFFYDMEAKANFFKNLQANEAK